MIRFFPGQRIAMLVALALSCATVSHAGAATAQEPLVIAAQGSFAVGGTSKTEPGTFNPQKPVEPAGQTYRGDHATVRYQIPVDAKKLPLVMWHGAGQSARTWESTPDGREGFQNIFLRRGFATYLVDQPRRGVSGRSMVETTLKPTADEQLWFNQFRVGHWPDHFAGVQFPRDAASLDQYFRQMTPNTGPYDPAVISDAVSALFDRTGDGVLVTHSQSGGPGWLTVIKNPRVKAVVAFEPGSGFVFPEGEVPAPMPSAFDTLQGQAIPMKDFMALTKIPIVIYYGDNIPATPSAMPGQDSWRVRLAMARAWRDAVNRHGGNVSVVHLPEIGIKGNSHFPFSDLNNLQIADLVSGFLRDKRLDR
ncbi:alpha/beta hydrolase [Uliginosibacterium sp. H1]|uniref:alpha/beta hydrolase n=1 Tax=Uliginosibacterium sp. H1 TaxID=3114757 RepID=UPI002E174D69|nr:alpha/beta fold hydrolase [Uliginosibacterium sp. H1]